MFCTADGFGDLELQQRGIAAVLAQDASDHHAKLSCWNCGAAMFTPMRIGGSPAMRHARESWQTRRNTHSPIGTISPVSSASAMKSVGCTRPRSGWFQRTSASSDTIFLRLRSKIGW